MSISKGIDTSKLKSIDLLGAGIWFVFHRRSFEVKNRQDIERFLADLKSLTFIFPCGNCGKHLREWVETCQILEKWDQGQLIYLNQVPGCEDLEEGYREVTLAYYFWLLHNQANSRANQRDPSHYRPEVSFRSVYEYYTGQQNHNCQTVEESHPTTSRQEIRVVELPTIYHSSKA